ncbi:hypothetical protein [Leifsonia xyli]|uniref:hypothetical protein n=1 Tax=Leifsonia xyli TaxID=1575 RepID=UPI003D66F3C1
MRSACVLCSNGCGCDIAVKDGRMVGIRGRTDDHINHGRLGPKGLYASWQGMQRADSRASSLPRARPLPALLHPLLSFDSPAPPARRSKRRTSASSRPESPPAVVDQASGGAHLLPSERGTSPPPGAAQPARNGGVAHRHAAQTHETEETRRLDPPFLLRFDGPPAYGVGIPPVTASVSPMT